MTGFLLPVRSRVQKWIARATTPRPHAFLRTGRMQRQPAPFQSTQVSTCRFSGQCQPAASSRCMTTNSAVRIRQRTEIVTACER